MYMSINKLSLSLPLQWSTPSKHAILLVVLLQIQSAEIAEKRIEQDPGSRGSSHKATEELQRISKAETIRS